jgi:hypothetical protein
MGKQLRATARRLLANALRAARAKATMMILALSSRLILMVAGNRSPHSSKAFQLSIATPGLPALPKSAPSPAEALVITSAGAADRVVRVPAAAILMNRSLAPDELKQLVLALTYSRRDGVRRH